MTTSNTSRFVAFLRAINVGGHTVRMDHLRRLFESLGFSGVETYIASGNVVFPAEAISPRELEKRIEVGLQAALGYEVASFVRRVDELDGIADFPSFPPEQLAAATAYNIAFLADPLDEASVLKVLKLRSEIDDFQVHGGEVYWLCRKKQSESKFSNAVLEKALGCRSTLRGVNTVRQIAKKFTA